MSGLFFVFLRALSPLLQDEGADVSIDSSEVEGRWLGTLYVILTPIPSRILIIIVIIIIILTTSKYCHIGVKTRQHRQLTARVTMLLWPKVAELPGLHLRKGSNFKELSNGRSFKQSCRKGQLQF